MNTSDLALLEFTTRLAYNIEGLSGELTLYFSRFLTFHFSKTLSIDQIHNIENKKASNVFKNKDEILAAATTFSRDDKVWSVAAILLLQVQAEKVDDRIVSRKIGLLAKDLISIFGLENEENRIADQQKQIENELHRVQNRPVIKIHSSIWPLTFDFAIRWVLLLSFNFFGLNKNLLTGYNVFFVPVFIIALVYVLGRRHKKSNKKLLDAYGGSQLYQLEYHLSTSQYTWLALLLGTSVFISYLLPDQFHVLALFGLTLYYFIYLRFFRLGKIEENDLVKQLETKIPTRESFNADENDEVIVDLETKLNSSTSRLEAYVLESALFGALSFSGFLQIMATDLISFSDLERFAANIFTASQSFINFDWVNYDAAIAGLSTKGSLFCLVSVESLICSIFFLAVIASRLRFSDIADKVRTAINLAKAYNTKEEALHDEQEVTGKKTQRLLTLTSKVNEQLHEAAVVLELINPVMVYMQYFRNAGILAFLILLISSSLFVTSVLGWTFLALVLATYFYFNRTTLNSKVKAFFLRLRIQFIKKGYWLFGIAILPQILAYVLKIFFHVQTVYWLFPLSNLLLGLYVCAWLILAAHVDESFGEIEMNSLRQSRWRLIKNTMAVFILIFGIALALKKLHLIGANDTMLISLTALAILMFFVGYYLTKVRWLGIICGGVIGVFSASILFKSLHWPWANEIVLISQIAFMVSIPIVIWKRNIFHHLLVRFCVVCFLITLWYSPVIYLGPMGLEIAFDHETVHIMDILKVVEHNNLDLFFEKGDQALTKGIAEADDYVNQYKDRFGFTIVHNHLIRTYQIFASSILTGDDGRHKMDTTLLPLALKAAREENKILSLFEFKALDNGNFEDFELEANVLLAMGKKNEAIQSLENIIKANPPEDLKETLRARIASLKTQSPL